MLVEGFIKSNLKVQNIFAFIYYEAVAAAIQVDITNQSMTYKPNDLSKRQLE